MIPDLCAQETAAHQLAKWWIVALESEPLNEPPSARIEVREDKIFAAETWLSLGNISLRLPRLETETTIDGDDWSREEHLYAALCRGGYEWAVPAAPTIETALLKSLANKRIDKEGLSPVGRVRDAIGYALLRLGLEMPLLDAQDVADLPFTRPLTLVADTNAVLQGGIDFSVRFLYPMARLRIPEPVHAELSNQALQYFAVRRGNATAPTSKMLIALRQRLTSQGGLRALLRVQLQSGVEIERLQVEAEEPRRFDLDADNRGGDRSAVADRMILETALRHRALLAPGHPVRIMTSDQGLARSALIEGIAPLYFPQRKWTSLFGHTYRGAVFAPFPGTTGSIWHRVPLTEVLWEFAVCFGAARLRLGDGKSFTITATHPDLAWSSFHAREDLLWIECSPPGGPSAQIGDSPTILRESSAPEAEAAGRSRPTAPKFSAEKLLRLWSWMATRRTESLAQLGKALEVSDKTTRDYVRLMASGGFLSLEEQMVKVDGESFGPLWTALRSDDWDIVRERLMRLPSFAALCGELSASTFVSPKELHTIRDEALPGFQRLGEICGAILYVPDSGLCVCEPRPTLDVFCGKALEAYTEAVASDSSAKPLVRSGWWLEVLAAKNRVHPLFVPSLLQEAITARRLDVIFEGSQPFRGKADHAFRRIVWRKDDPALEEVLLYRGDYLATNRASVHLKIEVSNP